MINISAPHPTYTSLIILPNPQLGDGHTVVRELNIRRSLDGTPYSYAKTSGSVRLTYSMELTRMKALEFSDFWVSFCGNKWKLVDHKNVTYVGYCVNDAANMQNFKRSLYCPDDPLGSEEAITISIEFEGVPQ